MFFFPKISEGCQQLIDRLVDHPEEWTQGMYEYVNKENPDIRIWTANGFPFIKLQGNDCFNLREKMAVNAAIKKSIANRLNIT